jgi:co-chaperonin GroES (HSP10)
MRNLIPLGPNLILKVEATELKSAGGIIFAHEGTREAAARDEGIIEAVGESAFDDLDPKNRPVVGTRVAIARYDGKILEETKDYTRRVIADTRILAIIEEDK